MSVKSRVTEADWADFRRRRMADDLALGLSPEEARAAAELAERQTRARLDWLSGRYERMTALWIMLGAYWNAFAEAHPEIDLVEPGEIELPDPPEQAELEAVEAEIAAARDHDVWPRHLYFARI